MAVTKKIDGKAAGEALEKAKLNLRDRRLALLQLCGAADFAKFESHKVRYCGEGKPKVIGTVLTFEGEVYDLLEAPIRAKQGEGDQRLVCYRCVKRDTRDTNLFVFLSPA